MDQTEQMADKVPQVDPAAARKDLLRALALCLLAVIFVRSFVFELFKIPSSSMVPTLTIGDHILVSKFNFGLTFPFTSWEMVRWGAPQRGDVIVFVYPKDESLYYIKRVVGLPGDTVEFKGKDLWVNGEAVAKEEVNDVQELEAVLGPGERNGVVYRETMDGGTHYVKYSENPIYSFSRKGEPHRVAEDHYFVMGDNRDDSYDSRSWGDVPRRHVRGRAQAIWLSLDREVGWGASEKIRWSRSFKKIR